jgi:hypothetical protein
VFSLPKDKIGTIFDDGSREIGDLVWIMLTIGIEGHDYFLRCRFQADLGTPYEPEICRIMDDLCASSSRDPRGHVSAGIIDDDHFFTVTSASLDNLTDGFLFVVRWDYRGELHFLSTCPLDTAYRHLR